jgi:hypothetical protein
VTSQETQDDYTMETQLFPRVPTVFEAPVPKGRRHASAGAPDSPTDSHITNAQASQTLPKSTALARDDSSIAFSSVFRTKDMLRTATHQGDEGIDEYQETEMLLDKDLAGEPMRRVLAEESEAIQSSSAAVNFPRASQHAAGQASADIRGTRSKSIPLRHSTPTLPANSSPPASPPQPLLSESGTIAPIGQQNSKGSPTKSAGDSSSDVPDWEVTCDCGTDSAGAFSPGIEPTLTLS